MSQRHPVQNDHIMLITTNIAERVPIFLDHGCAHEAVETLYRIQAMYPFFLYGFVIMPNHCHILMKARAPSSVSKIVGLYKRAVSHNIGRGSIWQPRFYMRIVHAPVQALSYIHQNPVRAHLVEKPEDYSWSSATGKWDISNLYA
ncbi:transposase [Candidatus Peregrinibacteria bacterium]|nr:transposase [Candidatus Peregrinibacteria bacterium]